MGRGGARPGAGRKPKALGKAAMKTRAIALKALEGQLTPLEVMLKTMLAHAAAGDMDKAANIAKDAAPYVHPRLSSVEAAITRKRDPVELTDDELAAAIVAGRGGDGTARETDGAPEPDRVH